MLNEVASSQLLFCLIYKELLELWDDLQIAITITVCLFTVQFHFKHCVVKDMCQPCHAECIICEDSSDHCPQCRHYKEDKKCVSTCSNDHFLDQETNSSCLPCHDECRSCSGPTDYDCDHCKHYKIYVQQNDLLNESMSNNTAEYADSSEFQELRQLVSECNILTCQLMLFSLGNIQFWKPNLDMVHEIHFTRTLRLVNFPCVVLSLNWCRGLQTDSLS